MASRSLKIRGFAFTLEVPQRVANVLRAIVPRRHATELRAQASQGLVFSDPPPLKLDARDPAAGVGFIRDRVDRRATASATPSRTADSPRSDEITAQPWYHTIELPNGVVTEGVFDHRQLVPRYGIPEDLQGKRVLDVGSADGFWSFEFERCGASVTAVDIASTADVDLPPAIREVARAHGLDDPLRDGFELARDLLGSKVEMLTTSVYDLDPERIGRFDMVHAGDLLLHLRDPMRALQAIASVTAGTALLSDVFDPTLTSLENEGRGLIRYTGGWSTAGWWLPSLPALVQMIADAGFSSVEVVTTYMLGTRESLQGPWRAVVRASR